MARVCGDERDDTCWPIRVDCPKSILDYCSIRDNQYSPRLRANRSVQGAVGERSEGVLTTTVVIVRASLLA